MKEKSVADKINESLRAQIESEDNSDDDQFDSLARVVDFDHDEYDVPKQNTTSTDFRKRNVKLLSEQSSRYKGKIVSRKDLEIKDDSSEMYENSSSEEEASDSKKNSSSKFVDNNSNESEMDSKSESNDESEIESADNTDEDDSDDESTLDDDAIVESKRQEAEIRKGVCIQNQLRIWERLLELRIRTQKVLNKSNQLPSPVGDSSSDYSSDIAKETTERTCLLLKNLLELKFTLTSQFNELRTHMKRPLQDNFALDKYESGEPPLKRVAVQLEDLHNHMRSYRNTVLLKWDDRTKLLTPGAGTKKKINEDFDVVRKIENALLNQHVLMKKSRTIQNAEITPAEDSKGEQTENEETQMEDPNVYDDSDFYHQQLRELIEYKANSSSNVAEVTKQIIELQKLRQKMKKKVDTRASKGRKIRYIVHNKLVNFMAPDDTTSIHWPDESKDELYKSLFAT